MCRLNLANFRRETLSGIDADRTRMVLRSRTNATEESRKSAAERFERAGELLRTAGIPAFGRLKNESK